MHFRVALFCIVALAVGGPAASASTKLESTWASPDAKAFAPKKILVAAPLDNSDRRLSAEVRMTQLIPNSVSSISTFLNEEEGDADRVRARIKEVGIDAVVILRPVAVDRTVKHVPGSISTYESFGGPGYGHGGAFGYWGPAYTTVYDPGYTREKTVATIETAVYAVEGEKLLWVSRSRTLNPDDVSSAVDEIIDANIDAMREQGLIAR